MYWRYKMEHRSQSRIYQQSWWVDRWSWWSTVWLVFQSHLESSNPNETQLMYSVWLEKFLVKCMFSLMSDDDHEPPGLWLYSLNKLHAFDWDTIEWTQTQCKSIQTRECNFPLFRRQSLIFGIRPSPSISYIPWDVFVRIFHSDHWLSWHGSWWSDCAFVNSFWNKKLGNLVGIINRNLDLKSTAKAFLCGHSNSDEMIRYLTTIFVSTKSKKAPCLSVHLQSVRPSVRFLVMKPGSSSLCFVCQPLVA